MPRLIVALNGPPGIGKDTIGAELRRHLRNVELFKMSQPLKDIAEIFGFDPYTVKGKAGGARRFQIDLAENYIRPKYGLSFFGHLLARKLEHLPPDTIPVITDSGFDDEIEPLKAVCEKLLIIQLHCEGFTFEGDSRDYLHHPSQIVVAERGQIDRTVMTCITYIMKRVLE